MTTFTLEDKELLAQKGISIAQAEEQLAAFKSGFPALEIKSAASIGNGIMHIEAAERMQFLNEWEEYLQGNHRIVKFVPASGAASRMFKNLFEYLDNPTADINDFIEQFFSHITYFAFFSDLNKACIANEGKSIESLSSSQEKRKIIENLLLEKGLHYGSLPKGLLKFHTYPKEQRTPVLEHLVEGALYAKNAHNEINIHFTISPEHKALFEKHIAANIAAYEEKFGVKYHISFSEQKPSTDTLATDSHNEPFRENNQLVFRPGGHGALIENLNEVEADVIFVKNIDNVVPDRLKEPTIIYKKLIAGILTHLQQQTFFYLKELENESISDAKLSIIKQFCENRLNNHFDGLANFTHSEQVAYLRRKLNRPIRVCGMVKNTGEPGGGPFLTLNTDGSVSPQILESSQIADKSFMAKATHFNPVDLVCGVRNYKGNKFDLPKYVDKNTGFISQKSKNGKELKALELPGLWNGAMSDWNTIFVEVPVETFNPVKTVNDLLRPQHQ